MYTDLRSHKMLLWKRVKQQKIENLIYGAKLFGL